MREWLAGVLESVGLRGLRHQVLPMTPEELQGERTGRIEEEVQRAVEDALAGWRPATGEDVRITEVIVVDSEYGDLVGRDLWINLGFAGEGARTIPEDYFLRLAPPVDQPGPNPSPEQRKAYEEYLAHPERKVLVPAPLPPVTMAWLEDLERRTIVAATRARPTTRFQVTFSGLLPDPEAGDDPGKLEDDEDGEPSMDHLVGATNATRRRGGGSPASGGTAGSPPRSGGVGHAALLPAGLVSIALGLFQLAPGCIAHLEDPRYREEGVVGQGTVTEKPSSKRTWRVKYRFVTAANRVVEGKDRMDLGDWMGLQVGGPVTVMYLRSRPESNRALPRADDDVLFGLAVVGVGLVLLVMRVLGLPA